MKTLQTALLENKLISQNRLSLVSKIKQSIISIDRQIEIAYNKNNYRLAETLENRKHNFVTI